MRGLERYTPYINLASGVISSNPSTARTHESRPRKIITTIPKRLIIKIVPPKARKRELAHSGQSFGFLLGG